jgi:glutathione S-transferase
MKLYYYESTNPWRACAVAKYLDLPVEFIHIDVGKGEHRSAEFLAINPNGKVPALVDGDVNLWESVAIMTYLSDKAGSDLWPKDERQIEMLRWITWDASQFTRWGGILHFQNRIKKRFGLGDPDAAVVEEALGNWNQFAAVLDAHLKDRTYLVGDTLSVADFAVACVLPFADVAKLPIHDYPEIKRFHDNLMELPAWREPFPA